MCSGDDIHRSHGLHRPPVPHWIKPGSSARMSQQTPPPRPADLSGRVVRPTGETPNRTGDSLRSQAAHRCPTP